jgi:hypothetical protein
MLLIFLEKHGGLAMLRLSTWLEQITDDQHPYYPELQSYITSSVAYLGARIFTSIPPQDAAAVTFISCAMSQTLIPWMSRKFEPYREVSLAPLSGQLTQLATSFVGANILCGIQGRMIPFRQTPALLASFLTANTVVHFAVRRFRRRIKE